MATFLQKLKKNQTETELMRAQMKAKQQAEVAVGEQDEMVPVLIDMSKTKTHVVVVAHVPGALKKNMTVTLKGENDILSIEGENYPPMVWQKDVIKGKREDSGKSQLAVKVGGIRECRYGKFFREIVLPEEVIFKKSYVTVDGGMIVAALPLFDKTKKG